MIFEINNKGKVHKTSKYPWPEQDGGNCIPSLGVLWCKPRFASGNAGALAIATSPHSSAWVTSSPRCLCTSQTFTAFRGSLNKSRCLRTMLRLCPSLPYAMGVEPSARQHSSAMGSSSRWSLTLCIRPADTRMLLQSPPPTKNPLQPMGWGVTPA